ncbi:hypothetical protein VTO42DRAFT_6572 [Malbranchea cinnamomea]
MLPNAAGLLVAGVVSLSGVAAHGHVSKIFLDGQEYGGWIADVYPYMPEPPETIGWPTNVTDNGFVSPDRFSSPEIICHRGGVPSAISAPVSAGGTVELEWSTWPESHHGPVLNYLAKVDGDFSDIDPSTLQFFKFDETGLVSGSNPGYWGTDVMLANGRRYSMMIPSTIAPGKYVLRHELVALQNVGAAQLYPQCINIEVTSNTTEGDVNPGGTPATELYSPADPGFLFNIYEQYDSYPIPGPDVFRD